VGFPIRISTDQSLVGSSPWLFAATHVLHRLQAPRHPPLALCSLENKDARARYGILKGRPTERLGRSEGSERQAASRMAGIALPVFLLGAALLENGTETCPVTDRPAREVETFYDADCLASRVASASTGSRRTLFLLLEESSERTTQGRAGNSLERR
jgi:hypothetical protein